MGSGKASESRERREKICFRESKRGRMTLSRNAVRTIFPTSRSELAVPKKSRAWMVLRRGPLPENSRSRGRKTACM